MIDLTKVSHHPVVTELVDVLCSKTQNTDRGFFQTEIAYFLAKIAGTMRAKLLTKERGEIPINIYAIALASSGYGKGHSINIMENEILSGFKQRFMEETFIVCSEGNLTRMAINRAARNGTTEAEEQEKIDREFRNAGAYAFTFDSGTPAAVKQMRQKLLMADIGAINLQIDEIGSNLIGSTEILTVFLELYDQGMIKQKLTKNTAENQRGEELDGKTPTNALMFGTPSKLFDGGQTEDQFYSMLDIGYARRCIFGWGEHKRHNNTLSPEEIFQQLINPQNLGAIQKWHNHFTNLADASKYNTAISVPDDIAIEVLRYRVDCERRAEEFADHEEIKKAEMSHRYFKAYKLAGAFAYVDEEMTLTKDHLYSAIKLVEESGDAFHKIMQREKAYVKLAKYLAGCTVGQTHADLNEQLPYYKSGQAARNEMMTMATAWGFKNNVMIRKEFVDGIEVFTGESLKETDTDEMILSLSDDFAYNYSPQKVPFDKLYRLAQTSNFHWCNHHFKNEHRREETAIPGFNMVVLDVDGTARQDYVHKLLKEFKFMTYTTKRHTEESHRFRLLLPINFHLELDTEEYKIFIDNIINWLPFSVDEGANQRSRKWLTNEKTQYFYNDGELLDILRFVPRTSRNEAYQQATKELISLDNLERWFAQRMTAGNRNNHMIKFALALVDSGLSYPEIETKVLEFNDKLNNKLSETELRTTVLRSVASKMSK